MPKNIKDKDLDNPNGVISELSIDELLTYEKMLVKVMEFISNNVTGTYEKNVYIKAGRLRQKIYSELYKRIEDLDEKENHILKN